MEEQKERKEKERKEEERKEEEEKREVVDLTRPTPVVNLVPPVVDLTEEDFKAWDFSMDDMPEELPEPERNPENVASCRYSSPNTS